MGRQVLDGVMEWGATRPVWQQEAILRLVNDDMSDDTVSELADLCVAEQRGDKTLTSVLPPAGIEEDEVGADDETLVHLLAISDVENVNILAPGQTLAFAPTGLTIVQGGNGSGKSGYARILKQVCRARSPQDVLPNAFTEDVGTPCATITFSLNGARQVVEWTSDDELGELEALTAVSVYDARATSIYIDKNHDLAYRPFGLDVYDRLADICEQVKAEIAQRITVHAAAKPRLEELHGNHPVGQFVAQLSATTNKAEVDALANWTEQDAEALRLARAHLTHLHQASPSQLAKAKRSQSSRAGELADRLKFVADRLSDDHLALLRRQRTDAANAREASDRAAREAFEDAPLPGVGSDSWRRLWDAARAYSLEHPYPDEDFPLVHEHAHCVLCQQHLGPDAGRRLAAFGDFVAGQLATEAERSEAAHDATVAGLESLDLSAAEALLLEIEEAGGPASDEVQTAFDSAKTRRQAALGEWDEASELPELRAGQLAEQLRALAQRLNEEAQDLEDADDDTALADAKQRVDRLEAREKLVARREEVLDAIRWHKENDALEDAKSRISSNAVTRRSRQVTEEVVSQGLLDDFAANLRHLGAGDLPVQLKPHGRSGQVLHQLELVGSSGFAPGDVLSEGECSVVALAAFFAEVDLAATPSPIVLDDPVTSLDHAYRERVVHHIFGEAQQRQVVVFTHDQVFVSELLDTFDNNNQRQLVSHYSVSRAAGAGLVTEGPPWELLKVNDRVKLLNARCAEGRALWKSNDVEAYQDHAKRTLGMLREAWERAVEEVVLNGTVQRFRRQVRTLKLPEVVKLTADDVAAVEAGMGLASTQAHDQAAAAAQPVPKPEEVEEQVSQLSSFCKEFRNRPTQGG
jgi:energy-coupling factor transporter ATP-binding protein EcfA2